MNKLLWALPLFVALVASGQIRPVDGFGSGTGGGSTNITTTTNGVLNVGTNGTKISGTATQALFWAGNNTEVFGTNQTDKVSITVGVKSNLTFNAAGKIFTLGSDASGAFGFTNETAGRWSMVNSNGAGGGDDWYMPGFFSMNGLQIRSIAGSGNVMGIDDNGFPFRTNSSSAANSLTNIPIGQTIFIDPMGNDATGSRTNQLRPYASPTNAARVMLSGDRLHSRGATYSIPPITNGSPAQQLGRPAIGLTNLNNISITGDKGAIWAMSGLANWGNGTTGTCSMLMLSHCANVLIDGMTFIGVRTNIVTDYHYAIRLDCVTNITFRNCNFLRWQDHAIVGWDETNNVENVEVVGCLFEDIGGVHNVGAEGVDGTAVAMNGYNINLHHNVFRRNFRDAETYSNGDVRRFQFRNNYTEFCYDKVLEIVGTNLSDVFISDNFCHGYATNSYLNNATFLNILQGSNIVVSGNFIMGYSTTVNHQISPGYALEEFRFVDNVIHDSLGVAISAHSQRVGETSKIKRATFARNYFKNSPYPAIEIGGSDIFITGNAFRDMNNLNSAVGRGVLEIGYPLYDTNFTNVVISGNLFNASAANIETCIVVQAMSQRAVIKDNEQVNYAAIVSDGGANSGSSPVNLLTAGMLYSDGTRMRQVTIGSGAAFDTNTGTLTATGGGGGTGASTNQVLTNLIGTVTRNVTNVVSLSTSNSTSKPLTNSYTAGVLTVFGLEAGSGATITPNGSNLVIAVTPGGGTPGGSTYSLQMNTNGTFFGDSFWQYFPASAAGGDGFAKAMLNDGTHTNMIRDTGFGTYSTHSLYLFASNTSKLELKIDGSFGPAGFTAYSNAFSLGFFNFPWSTSFVNQVSAKVGIDVGVGSGLNGKAAWGDNSGTNFQFEGAPAMSGTGTTGVVYRLPKNTTTGPMVALYEGGITNQMTNVTLAAGQYLTYDGTAYVASNLPSAGASSGGPFTNLSLYSTLHNSPLTLQNLTQDTNFTLTIKNTNGVITSGISSNGLSWLIPDGSAANPAIQFLSQADGTGYGLYYNNQGISLALNGTERWRFQNTGILVFDVGTGTIGFGSALGTTDLYQSRDANGTLSLKHGATGSSVTNRIYREYTNNVSFSPTNAAWIEMGSDGVFGWSFLRSMADRSNLTTQPLVLGINTNEMLKIDTNGTVALKVPTVRGTEAGDGYQPLLLTGTGSANTNFTFLASQPELIASGETNVSITAVMGTDPTRVYYWNLTITNGTGTSRPIIFDQTTNSWRFSGDSGTNSPSSITNMSALMLQGRSYGTNTRIWYTYFPWP